MGRTTGFLQKGYTAGAAIAAHTLLKFGAADGQVINAVDAAAAIIGVQSELDVASGDRASVAMVGNIEDVKLGGTVTRGDPITSDASGFGVAAAPVAGTNNYIVGFAEASGVSGDIIPVVIAPGRIQG